MAWASSSPSNHRPAKPQPTQQSIGQAGTVSRWDRDLDAERFIGHLWRAMDRTVVPTDDDLAGELHGRYENLWAAGRKSLTEGTYQPDTIPQHGDPRWATWRAAGTSISGHSTSPHSNSCATGQTPSGSMSSVSPAFP